jgi:hypothetical protein
VPPAWTEALETLAALEEWGYHDEVARLLDQLGEPGVRVDGAALVALAQHWRLTRDRAWAEARTPAILAGVQACASRWRHRDDPMRRPGLAAAAELLDAVGQPLAAARVRRRLAGVVDRGSPPGGHLFLHTLRNDLVRELDVADAPGPVLALCPTYADAWRGQPVDVRDAPTAHGRASFSVRWHGERPALLWELEDPAEGLTISAPGLDPVWTTTEARGEVLLGALGAEQGASFS